MLSVDTAVASPASSIPQTETTSQTQPAGDFGLALETECQRLESASSPNQVAIEAASVTTEGALSAAQAVQLEISELAVELTPGAESIPVAAGQAEQRPTLKLPGSSVRPSATDERESLTTDGDSDTTLSAILCAAWGFPLWQKLPIGTNDQAAASVSPQAGDLGTADLTQGAAASIVPSALANLGAAGSDAAMNAAVPFPVADPASQRIVSADDAPGANGFPLPEVSEPQTGILMQSALQARAALVAAANTTLNGETSDAASALNDGVTVSTVKETDAAKKQGSGTTPVLDSAFAMSEGSKLSNQSDQPSEWNQAQQHAAANAKAAQSESASSHLVFPRDTEPAPRESRESIAAHASHEALPAASSLDPVAAHSIVPKPAGAAQDVESIMVVSGSNHGPAASSAIDSKGADGIAPSRSDQWSEIEKSSVVSQIVEKAQRFHWDHNSEIVIALRPEALGRISLRASIVDQTIVATIAAESEKTRNILASDLPALHRALQQDGVPARIEVVQARQTTFGFAGGGQSHQQPAFRQGQDSHNPLGATYTESLETGQSSVTLETRDSRYGSRSIHLIA